MALFAAFQFLRLNLLTYKDLAEWIHRPDIPRPGPQAQKAANGRARDPVLAGRGLVFKFSGQFGEIKQLERPPWDSTFQFGQQWTSPLKRAPSDPLPRSVPTTSTSPPRKSFDTNYAHIVTVKKGATAILHDVLFQQPRHRRRPAVRRFRDLRRGGFHRQGRHLHGERLQLRHPRPHGTARSRLDRRRGGCDRLRPATRHQRRHLPRLGFRDSRSAASRSGSTGQLEFRGSSVTRINGTVTAEAGVLTAFDSGATLETAWTNLINDDLRADRLREGSRHRQGKIVETAWTGTYTLSTSSRPRTSSSAPSIRASSRLRTPPSSVTRTATSPSTKFLRPAAPAAPPPWKAAASRTAVAITAGSRSSPRRARSRLGHH